MIAPSHIDINSCKHKNASQERTSFFERLQMIFDSALSIQQKALLTRIAIYAGDNGECFASAKTLQKDLSISRSHLFALLSSVKHLLKTEIRDGRAFRRIRWDGDFTPVQLKSRSPASSTPSREDASRPSERAGESESPDSPPYIERSINTQRTQMSEEHVFLNGFEQSIDHDIDWLVAEYEFMTRWNSTQGVATRQRPAVPSNLRLQFQRLWSDPDWREDALRSLDKFPLRNGSIISLKKFLEESTVDDVLSGVYDFTKGKSHDVTRFPREDGWSDFESQVRSRKNSTA